MIFFFGIKIKMKNLFFIFWCVTDRYNYTLIIIGKELRINKFRKRINSSQITTVNKSLDYIL